MKQHGGVWLPDGEKHMTVWMTEKHQVVDGKLTYQLDKQRLALSYVKRFRTAVDVGGHVGLWSMNLVKEFAMVHAFEPVGVHRECFTKNVPPTTAEHGWALHACALGEKEGMVNIWSNPTSSGDSWVKGKGEIPMLTLDSFDLHDVDFIKLDCEGYELFALRGGEAMLKRERPVVIVEQKRGFAQKFGLPETGAVSYLQNLGYKLVREVSGDYILVHPLQSTI